MTTSAPASIDEAIDWLRKHFQSVPAQAVAADFQIELSGDNGGVIGLEVRDGLLVVQAAPRPQPDVRLTLSLEDWLSILDGTENADLLFTAGRLTIDGDLSLAMKLRTLFRAPA